MLQSWRTWAAVRPSAPKLSNALGVQEAEADLSGGGTMNQTMPIVKVRDLITALEAYIAQKRRTE
jgi:hypothetical protein